jgi:undecaprenyl-diphosphatase
MRPVWLLAAVAVAVAAYLRRRSTGPLARALSALVAVALALVGLGLVETPDVEELIVDLGTSLGPYTYVLVGALAFLETGAFVGLVAPGETAVLVGGVVAGQGQVDPLALIALVWCCAVAGDVTSYTLGRKLGRDFLLRHGPKLKITEKRLLQVEGFFERHGGVTLLVGRFIGVVRALLPFVAGASRVPLAKFLPYDVLGAGVWSATFVLLGYLFSRSIGTVTTYLGQGLFLLGSIAALVVGVVYVRRLVERPHERARAQAWLARQAERPAVEPLVRRLEPAWRRVGRPFVHHAARPARFVYERLTPGGLGLELTTLVAIVAVGGFTAMALAESIDDQRRLLPGDGRAFSIGRALYAEPAERVIEALTHIGSLPVIGAVTAATAAWAVAHKRRIEGLALVVALALTFVLVHAAKALEDRPRPSRALVSTMNQSYPSGHAAYAVALVACAVVLVRTRPGLGMRSTVITGAVVLMVLVALSRIYLRAHYLSDVAGGLGLGAAVFASCGIAALVVFFVRHNGSS